MHTKTESSIENDSVSSGVPGFSSRLNDLFDMAGAPKDYRLSWGAERWNCVPNTIGNWIKRDMVPKRYATLQLVVNDLLNSIPGRYDINLVIAWLYTGSNNPFEKNSVMNSEQIDHLLQIRIFNKIYEMCRDKGIDFENIDSIIANRVISMIYWYAYFNNTQLSNDEKIEKAVPYITFWIDNVFSKTTV